MLSRDVWEIDGSEAFLLSQTDLKSDGDSVCLDFDVVDREFAASSKSPSDPEAGLKPNCGAVGSGGGFSSVIADAFG